MQEPAVVNVKQSIAIFQQIVSGVCYIHSQSIVHHDLKVSLLNNSFSNILVRIYDQLRETECLRCL
jgi:serine/threonine protein kinase